MENFSFYVVFESQVIYDKNLTNTEKLLYSYISGLSLKTGKCFASNSYLANLLQTTNRHVQRSLEKLRKQKYIIIKFNDYKRVITPTINKFVELRTSDSTKSFEMFNWLEESDE